MRILGIDPGSRITGYGIIDTPKKYIASGTIRLDAFDMPERLNIIFDDLNTIIRKYQPNCVVIEQVSTKMLKVHSNLAMQEALLCWQQKKHSVPCLNIHHEL